ncbi:MAG: pyruvate kinase, partial [Thermoplasmatota archaeon]
KIEHIKAVENLDDILKEADGIMIARGDLGVEVPASDVPIIQKDIIQRCNLKEMPVIVATQMLMSMTESPRATRAEVSDVANAVIDGSDAVMLSEETAVGKYPVKSVEFMSEVVGKVEKLLETKEHHTAGMKSKDVADIISKNVWQASRDLDAKYIVAHTSSGYTAHKISKFRPAIDVIAFTDSVEVQRRLNLVWGVRPFLIDFPEHVDEMIHNSAEFLFDNEMVEMDDTLILTAGVPQPVTGITNMMEIRTVRSLLEE